MAIPEPSSSSSTVSPDPSTQPPDSQQQAFEAATAIATSAEARAFDVASDDADHEELREFGDWRRGESWTGVLSRNVDDEVVGSPDEWSFDYSLSSTSTLASGGQSYPFAVVRLVGCTHVNWVVDYGDPQMQTWSVGDALPRSLIVQYDPARDGWFVTGGDDLTGAPGAPHCD